MKIVKIVRVTKGQEVEGAQQLADFYNEMKEKNARTSRAIITSVGDDIVYTVFADVNEDEDDDFTDDLDDIVEENSEEEEDDDDAEENFLS